MLSIKGADQSVVVSEGGIYPPPHARQPPPPQPPPDVQVDITTIGSIAITPDAVEVLLLISVSILSPLIVAVLLMRSPEEKPVPTRTVRYIISISSYQRVPIFHVNSCQLMISAAGVALTYVSHDIRVSFTITPER